MTKPPVFDREEAVRKCYDSQEMFQKMVVCFFDEVDVAVAGARDALERHDAESLCNIVHRLRNTVVYLGAGPATAAIKHLEHVGQSNELAQARSALEQVTVELEQLKAALAAYQKSNG